MCPDANFGLRGILAELEGDSNVQPPIGRYGVGGLSVFIQSVQFQEFKFIRGPDVLTCSACFRVIENPLVTPLIEQVADFTRHAISNDFPAIQ